jgi:hypothetical protein
LRQSVSILRHRAVEVQHHRPAPHSLQEGFRGTADHFVEGAGERRIMLVAQFQPDGFGGVSLQEEPLRLLYPQSEQPAPGTWPALLSKATLQPPQCQAAARRQLAQAPVRLSGLFQPIGHRVEVTHAIPFVCLGDIFGAPAPVLTATSFSTHSAVALTIVIRT